MNFNYENSRVINLKSTIIDRKNEEQKGKKEEEELKEPNRAQNTAVEFQTEKVTANADNLLTNYIKGALHVDKSKTKSVIIENDKSNAQTPIQRYIDQWNSLDNNTTVEEKMNLLTKIIDIYENVLGDQDSARIWRVRRLTVTMDVQAQEGFDHYQALKNHVAEPGSFAEYSTFPDFNEDLNAYLQMFPSPENNMSNDKLRAYWEETLSPEEFYVWSDLNRAEALFMETYMLAISQNETGYTLINDLTVVLASADQVYINCLDMIHNPIMAEEDWQSSFAELEEKFNKFKEKMRHGHIGQGPMEAGVVADLVYEIIGALEELDGMGFPYGNTLRIAIIGYLEGRGISSEIFGL